MSDLKKIEESKRKYRRKLAASPIEEKLPSRTCDPGG
jgi:hypothetical protein